MDDLIPFNITVINDPLEALKVFTNARIALGRTGVSIPLKESLNFKLAHAHARDAVYSELDLTGFTDQLQVFDLPFMVLQSMAQNRAEYLQRPDLGKQLNPSSESALRSLVKNENTEGYDISLVLADGLSANAVNQNAFHLLEILIPGLKNEGLSVGPIIIVKQARVAIGDAIGEMMNARISIVLIGERPGLSASDGLGAYLTYAPAIGLTDESRNCISNIRPLGLNYSAAANKILYLVKESLKLKTSGVELKDNSTGLENNLISF